MTPPLADSAASIGNGYFGGFASSSQSSTRLMRPVSIVGGVVPVPNAALLLRSSTSELLPSQWRFNPWRGFWFQIDGKSAGADSSFAGSTSIGKLKITFAELNVSTR